MSFREPSDRRRFLAAAIAGIGLLATRRPFPVPHDGAALPPSVARLAGLLADGGSARHIGRLYLQQAPWERDVRALARRIVDSLPGRPGALDRVGDAGARRLIEQRIRQDFADGLTTSVDGWVLSVTEARLYAVTALAEAA